MIRLVEQADEREPERVRVGRVRRAVVQQKPEIRRPDAQDPARELVPPRMLVARCLPPVAASAAPAARRAAVVEELACDDVLKIVVRKSSFP